MVIRDILLARRTGGHVHLAHMSTKGSVELIRWGKERGINVSAEVCPHHLSLTEDRVGAYDTNAKMNPPLRTAADVTALQEAVKDGTIDLVATDHAPHHYDEKEREFADAPNGIVGLETALAVIVTNLVETGILSYSQMVDRMACTPARLFNLPGGSLRRGTVADVADDLLDLSIERSGPEHDRPLPPAIHAPCLNRGFDHRRTRRRPEAQQFAVSLDRDE